MKSNFSAWSKISERVQVQGAGLSEVARVLKKLGSPHQNYHIIHVAGTNGKGSVCTLLARCLSASGKKTGLFVSPHLKTPCERISINGQPISQDDFSRVVESVFEAEETPLNFFEILTVAAFVYFAQKKVFYVVLETGLGGAKDPTNVCVPTVCVITSIGWDHTHLLGNSLEKIAREKGGIIKSNTPVFIGHLPPKVFKEIEKIAHEKHAPLYQPTPAQKFTAFAYNWAENTTVLLAGNGEKWPLHILGFFQAHNAGLVRAVCDFLKVPLSAQKQGFQTVAIQNRFEVIFSKNIHLILDGAHNVPAVESFIALWKQHPAYPHATLVFGAMKDKDFPKMLSLLAPHFEKIILTQLNLPRCACAEELFKNCPHANKEIVPDYRKALALAADISVPTPEKRGTVAPTPEKWVAVVGSFYLTSAVREAVLNCP